MKMSTRARYGLRLMVDLAVKDGKGPILLKDVSRSQEISEKYLSQIIIPLKTAGLVKSFRGAHGGYTLQRDPAKINLLEVVSALEGDLSLVECVANLLEHLHRQAIRANAELILGERASEVLRHPPCALQALAGYARALNTAEHAFLGASRIIPV